MSRTRTIPVILILVVSALWLYLLYSVWRGPLEQSGTMAQGFDSLRSGSARARSMDTIHYPQRFRATSGYDEPPPLSEIEHNLTLYLSTLHSTFKNLQGSKAVAIDIWEAYLNVTKNTVMKWDDENRHRFPKPRQDNSIYVSLGTYRGERVDKRMCLCILFKLMILLLLWYRSVLPDDYKVFIFHGEASWPFICWTFPTKLF